jgi:hypothetical protein
MAAGCQLELLLLLLVVQLLLANAQAPSWR